MVIDALQSAGDVLSGLNQLKTVTEVVSKILITPKEIVNNEELAKNSLNSVTGTIQYLQNVKNHLDFAISSKDSAE